jgi:hypothetical protein
MVNRKGFEMVKISLELLKVFQDHQLFLIHKNQNVSTVLSRPVARRN